MILAVEKGNRRCRKVVYYLTIPTFPDKILENTRFLVFIVELQIGLAMSCPMFQVVQVVEVKWVEVRG